MERKIEETDRERAAALEWQAISRRGEKSDRSRRLSLREARESLAVTVIHGERKRAAAFRGGFVVFVML